MNENSAETNPNPKKSETTMTTMTLPGSSSARKCKKRQRVPRVAVFFGLVPLLSAFLCCPKSLPPLTTAFQSSILATFVTTRGRSKFGPFSCFGHDNIFSIPEADRLTDGCKERIVNQMRESGLWEDNIDMSSEQLVLLAKDFVDRPEVFSSLLISDFGFPVLVAHQTRALAMAAIRGEHDSNSLVNGSNNSDKETGTGRQIEIEERTDFIRISDPAEAVATNNATGQKNGVVEPHPVVATGSATRNENGIAEWHPVVPSSVSIAAVATNNGTGQKNGVAKTHPVTPPSSSIAAGDPQTRDGTITDAVKTYSDKEFRSTVVNERAKRRKRSIVDYSYGLPNDYATIHPKLASELEDYYTFMTQPSTYAQESPIRDATAKVYLNHAKLFLGWCRRNAQSKEDDDKTSVAKNSELSNEELSLFAVIPSMEKESADSIIRFVLWMRSRDISVSYEANLLRGIIKMLKFRFAKESKSDPLEGQNTFDDIPIIKEVRKLHRDANQRQRLAPRSSDESKKWITWKEYICVTQNLKNEVLELIGKYEKLPVSKRRYAKGDFERIHSLEQIKVAEAYQRYLILAILACIPDRQRTIRELEVGRTLMKDAETDCWVVKHGPSDYKTGKHYGERPAMQLTEELTPAIDDFVENWRPALKPSTNVLLVQSKTGKPMTSNSIFKRVVRCCFKYTGKSVNPHLLRDIIVTHVRETDASEKELEALALYMGHSIQMQRTSYDRRTLSTKVAPAIKLMRTVNNVAA